MIAPEPHDTIINSFSIMPVKLHIKLKKVPLDNHSIWIENLRGGLPGIDKKILLQYIISDKNPRWAHKKDMERLL